MLQPIFNTVREPYKGDPFAPVDPAFTIFISGQRHNEHLHDSILYKTCKNAMTN